MQISSFHLPSSWYILFWVTIFLVNIFYWVTIYYHACRWNLHLRLQYCRWEVTLTVYLPNSNFLFLPLRQPASIFPRTCLYNSPLLPTPSPPPWQSWRRPSQNPFPFLTSPLLPSSFRLLLPLYGFSINEGGWGRVTWVLGFWRIFFYELDTIGEWGILWGGGWCESVGVAIEQLKVIKGVGKRGVERRGEEEGWNSWI